MIKSMTGYGKTTLELPEKVLSIEIRTLNSKQADVILKIPSLFRIKETEIRSLILDKLERGKLELSISMENTGSSAHVSINKALALQYYREFKNLDSDLEEESFSAYLPIILKMPDVFSAEKEELDEANWEKIRASIIEVTNQVNEFRLEEGVSTEKDLRHKVTLILEYLEAVNEFEGQRAEKVKERLLKELENLSEKVEFDRNRFEQELIYYLDKLDINEEKVRLKKHCEYFIETMDSLSSNGKKLGFISQEMGREINTLGAKANDQNIQKLVVQMKDELEKIKEQLFNIL